MIQLKSFTLKSRVIQSPMAGCTDLAFRLIARKYGMEFAFLEMVSAAALVHENEKTARKMQTVPADSPLGAQLVGCEPELMAEAAGKVESLGYTLLDLNLGCPVAKVISPGGGSALLKEPEKCRALFRAVVKAVKNIPVTVKMRKGFADPSGNEAILIARIAEEEGISAVAVHGRTRVQAYKGKADWEAIGRIKAAVNIPVIGNGDIESGEDAKRMLEVSGCDGVMLGRGALGNPWIYKTVEAVIHGKEVPRPPTFEEVKEAAIEHFELEIKYDGPRAGFLKCRRILCWYFKNYPGVADFRYAINHSKDSEEMREILLAFEPRVLPTSAATNSELQLK